MNMFIYLIKQTINETFLKKKIEEVVQKKTLVSKFPINFNTAQQRNVDTVTKAT